MQEQQQFLAITLKHKTLKHSQSLGKSELSHGTSKFILKKKPSEQWSLRLKNNDLACLIQNKS